jgi:hypothetical protein
MRVRAGRFVEDKFIRGYIFIRSGTERACKGGKDYGLNSGGALFESRPIYRLSRVTFLVVFFSLSGKIRANISNQAIIISLHILCTSSFINYPNIPCAVLSNLLTASLNKL